MQARQRPRRRAGAGENSRLLPSLGSLPADSANTRDAFSHSEWTSDDATSRNTMPLPITLQEKEQ